MGREGRGGGQSTLNSGKKVVGGEGRGGQLTLNSGKRVVVGGEGGEGRGGGGGINWHTTWKGSAKTLQGLPLTMLIWGGQSTLKLERLCKDIARITSDNVDPWGGGQLTLNSGKKVVGGEGREGRGRGWSTLNSGKKVVGGEGGEGRGVNRHSSWKGSAKTLQGLPPHQETNVQFPQITNSYISLYISLLLLLFQQIKIIWLQTLILHKK